MYWSSWRIVLIFAGLLSIGNAALSAEDATDKPADKIVADNNQFALELYGKLNRQPGNLFCSPYSVSTALAMTYAGARGETANQMAQAMHFGAKDEAFHAAFGRVIGDFNSAGKGGHYQLTVANALWVQQGENFPAAYMRLVTGNYDATIKQLDFKSDTEAARRTINDWIERKTNSKIKDLLQPGGLLPETGLVLTNAIYFKSAWLHPFNETLTKDAPFTRVDGSKVNVPMMRLTEWFGYLRIDDLQAVELPYSGGKLSMVVLLPDRNDGLPALEKRLSGKLLAELSEKSRGREVVLSLPKFKFTSTFELSGVLSEMGMRDAFTSAADFSGIGGSRKLYLQLVTHKAFVDVHEKGTEAAAATVVRAPPPNGHTELPIIVTADHPFVFLIREKRTGSILFIGRILDPQG